MYANVSSIPKIIIMKNIFLSLLLLAAVSANAQNNPVLTIEGGQVQGVLADDHPDVFVYRGIPYAAPPIRAKMEQAQSAENAAAALELKAQNGARQEQIQGAYQVWQQAKAGLEIAEKSYQRIQRLFDEGVISAQKRDEVYANYKAMEAQCKAAESQYQMTQNGARREDKLAAAAQVGRARGAVQEVNSYIHETVQIAQMEGEVSSIYPKVGELVGTGSPIMTISMMQDMWGTFNVREDQLNGMEVGKTFKAFVPAFNKEVEMKVYYMKDQGSFAVWKATKANGQYDLKTFEVRARPTEKFDGLRPGMSLIVK